MLDGLATDLQREDFLVWASDLHCFLTSDGDSELGTIGSRPWSCPAAGLVQSTLVESNFQILLVGCVEVPSPDGLPDGLDRYSCIQ